MKRSYEHFSALCRYYTMKSQERTLVMRLHQRGDTLTQLEARQDRLARHQLEIQRFLDRNRTTLEFRQFEH